MTVEVPPEFAAIGYSGLFHVEASMMMTPAEVEQWRTKVPCLMRASGWMALRVTPDNYLLLVRRDTDAVVEAMTRRRARQPADVGESGRCTGPTEEIVDG